MRTTLASTMVFVFALIAMLALNADDLKGQVIKDGLVAHWSFDEADIDGKTVKNVSRNNDGEIIGDPQVAEGKVGGSLELDGVAENVKIAPLDISGRDKVLRIDRPLLICGNLLLNLVHFQGGGEQRS